MIRHTLRRPFWPPVVVSALLALACRPALLSGEEPQPPSLSFKIQRASERLEMTVNTSRILTLDQKIWKAQVNNTEVLEQTPLSPTQVSVFAKKPGVTQVYLFGEDNRVFTVDVIVYGDAQELAAILKAQFPHATLKVIPVASNVMISGYVDQPEHADLIARMAEEYYPKVINSITVSGVQQVLLHVKVMEVSRTKLRNLGFDWAQISGSNLFQSAASGLLMGVIPAQLQQIGDTGQVQARPAQVQTAGGSTVSFAAHNGTSAFFGVLEALRQDDMMKILAEPTLVTISGRPASFLSGGEFPILVPQSLGTVSIEYKRFGTELDFVPIVLGNGRIHLEVRPRVSERDVSGGVTLESVTAPALRTREVETGVEMQAGQTLAIAGLVQSREETQNKGIPWVSDVPYVGALFRRVHHERNEVELLILVTPELVEAMDAEEVPPCGPGMRTTSPGDIDLYLKGHLEVPNCCPPGCDPSASGPGGPGTMLHQEGMILEEGEPGAGGQQAGVAKAARSRNRYASSKPPGQPADSQPAGETTEQGLIGPAGYDVLQ